MNHHVWVRGLPLWCEPRRLLGPGEWTMDGSSANATLPTHAAADLDARLRGIGIGGSVLIFTATPPLPRAAVRAARTTDARRRRDTTPGFTRPGTKLDDEGRYSLTPEALAFAIGQRAGGRTVIDAGCGAGGSTIGFARAGCPVVAIERDPKRLADARHNVRVYGVEGKVTFHGGALEDVLPRVQGDILFLDPPWGVEWSRGYLTLTDLPALAPLLGPARTVRLPCTDVWVKVPPSFDVRSLPGASPEAWYGAAEGDGRRVKFLLLRCKVEPLPGQA